MDISVIIVSWNVCELLDKCLASLHQAQLAIGAPQAIGEAQAGLPLTEIIVVDSASSDGSLEMLRAKYPQVIVLPQKENIGFTRASNIGLRQAQAPCLMLLNPDTEVHPAALRQMHSYLQQHPAVGIIGPHTFNSDGSHQSTRRRFPTLTTALFESTWLAAYAPPAVERDYRLLDSDDRAILDVDWVQGSAMMVRRAVYEAVGGLDEGFRMYAEEMDWCKRAKAAGWQVVYHGAAQIVHHGGKSSEQVPAFSQIQFHTSRLRYFRKHHGRLPCAALRISILLQFAWQLLLESVKGLGGHKRQLRWQRVKIYWQVLRSGLKAGR